MSTIHGPGDSGVTTARTYRRAAVGLSLGRTTAQYAAGVELGVAPFGCVNCQSLPAERQSMIDGAILRVVGSTVAGSIVKFWATATPSAESATKTVV